MKSCRILDNVLIALLLLGLAGCEVTKEKIDIWKLSDKGAAKLRACVLDKGQTMDIRVECAQALAEMGLVYYLSMDLGGLKGAATDPASKDAKTKEVTSSDGKQILANLFKKLIAAMKGSNPKETTRVKTRAKDALYSIRGMLNPKQQKEVDTEVVRWILADFQKRNEGDHSAEKIIKASGPVAGPLLAEAMTHGGTRPLYVAILLRAIGSQADRDAAAKHLVQSATRAKKLSAPTLEALGRVGSVHAVEYLLTLTARDEMAVRVYALRALQLWPHVKALPAAKAIASDDTLKDKKLLVREEAFNLLSMIPDPRALDALTGFLEHANEDIRYTAMHRIIEGFKAKGLPTLLKRLSMTYTYKKQDLADLVTSYVVDLGPTALPPIRAGLGSPNWVAKLVSIKVLAQVGTKKDLVALEKLVNDKTKIKGWENTTIGSEAQAAAKQIVSRKK